MRQTQSAEEVVPDGAAIRPDLYKTFELYLAERTRLTGIKLEASKAYDRTILTFSAGAIALSITFLERVALAPTARWLLYGSWISFALAIASTMYSLLASQRAVEDEISILDERYKALMGLDAEERALVNPPTPLTPFGVTMRWLARFDSLFTNRFAWFGELVKWLNRCAGALFVIGIVLFGGFALKNWLHHEDAMNKERTTDSRNVKLPDGIDRTTGGTKPDRGVLPPIKDLVPPPPPKEKK